MLFRSTLTLAHGAALAGNASAVASGAVAANRSIALSGNQSAATVGGLVPAQAISSNTAVASVGAVLADRAVELAGAAASVSAGDLAPNRSVALSGNAISGAAGMVSADIGGSAIASFPGMAGLSNAGVAAHLSSTAPAAGLDNHGGGAVLKDIEIGRAHV